MTVSVPIPGLKLETVNVREHHMARARRVKRVRNLVTLVLRGTVAGQMMLVAPLVVTITRVGPRKLDDDNATGSAKACRDAIAGVLGVDDRDPRVRWQVVQTTGQYATHIRIEAASQVAIAGTTLTQDASSRPGGVPGRDDARESVQERIK